MLVRKPPYLRVGLPGQVLSQGPLYVLGGPGVPFTQLAAASTRLTVRVWPADAQQRGLDAPAGQLAGRGGGTV